MSTEYSASTDALRPSFDTPSDYCLNSMGKSDFCVRYTETCAL